jgi:hypothetical protein
LNMMKQLKRSTAIFRIACLRQVRRRHHWINVRGHLPLWDRHSATSATVGST